MRIQRGLASGLVALSALLALAGCGGGGGGGGGSPPNTAPNITGAAITPAAAYTNDTLVASATVSDPDNNTVTTTYEWRRNGTVVGGQTSSSFPANLTTKNDTIVVRITANDGRAQTTAEASTVILDSPAVLSLQAPAPTALSYGDTASFKVTATDADDDAIPGFEVAFGPAGFSVTPQGDVTWTAAGPLFDRATDFNWGVRVLGAETPPLTGTIAVTDATRDYPLRRANLSIPIQHSGLRIADLDGNGSEEILIGSSQAVYVLSRSGSVYRQSWVYPFDTGPGDTYGNGLQAVTSADIDGDHRQEIFFSKAGRLVRLDGIERREAASADVRCRGLEVADLDGNGTQELVCLGTVSGYEFEMNGRIVVLNPDTLAEIWSTPQLSVGRVMAIGNVDGDPALEIVTGGGFVYDGATHENQWNHGDQFGRALDTGDLDGDGIEEIIAAGYWLNIRAYSAASQSILWEFALPSSDIYSVAIADANGDGDIEAIIGSGPNGDLLGLGYNTTTHQPELLWQVDPQEDGVSAVAVGDVDADGTDEVVWGAGQGSSLRDQIVIATVTPTLNVEWQSGSIPELVGPFYGGDLARIGGGASRLMFAVSRSDSFDGMRAIAVTPMTGEFESSDELADISSQQSALAIADYDQDNIDEVLFSDYDRFGAFDSAAESVEWQSTPQNPPHRGFAIEPADMNGDGHADLVGLTDRGYVEIHDIHGQSLLWRGTHQGNGTSFSAALALGDLDDDGEQEIVAAFRDRIVIYGKDSTGTTYAERANITHGSTIMDVVVADLDGDSEPEIYVLSLPLLITEPSLHVFDANLQVVRAMHIDAFASALFVEQSAFARKNLLLAIDGDNYLSDGNSELRAIDPVTGAAVWHSPPLAGRVSRDSLQFVDVDGDGADEITFGTANGMYQTR